MKRQITSKEYVINAIATYIVVQATFQGIFTKEVDTMDIAQMYQAGILEQNAAYVRAREILGSFI